jgi:hypothetical protein
MADSSVVDWPVEVIPDGGGLFLRVLDINVSPDGSLMPGAIRPTLSDGALSLDWDKYSTPEETRGRAKNNPPERYGVVEFQAGAVRSIDGLSVEHTPDRETMNRAHSSLFGLDVEGPLKTKRRNRLIVLKPAWRIPVVAARS